MPASCISNLEEKKDSEKSYNITIYTESIILKKPPIFNIDH